MLTMGTFKIVLYLTTAVFILYSISPISARPPGGSEEGTNNPISKDYYALQDILGMNLAGTSTEKAKVVDLLLQLLEEIDLPTLCEVIVNDTKGNRNTFVQVPIKSTKIDTDLLNDLMNEIQESTATAEPIRKVETHSQKTIPHESSIDISYAVKENKPVFITSQYHGNEIRNTEDNIRRYRQALVDDSFDNAKYTEAKYPSEMSDEINIASKKAKFNQDTLEKQFLYGGQQSFSSHLNKQKDSINNVNLDLAQSTKIKQAEDDFNMEKDSLVDIKYKNMDGKSQDTRKPRTQIYSKSLVLGDWLSYKKRPHQDREDSYSTNKAKMEETNILNSLENYVDDGSDWSGDDKSERKNEMKSEKQNLKQNQQKYMRWGNPDDVEQMFEPEFTFKSPRSRFSADTVINPWNSDNLSNGQHEVDYLEELKSTFKASKQFTNSPINKQTTNPLNESFSNVKANSQQESETESLETIYERIISGTTPSQEITARQEKQRTPLQYHNNMELVRIKPVTQEALKWAHTSKSVLANKGHNHGLTQLSHRMQDDMDGTTTMPYKDIQTNRADVRTVTSTYKTVDLKAQEAISKDTRNYLSLTKPRESNETAKTGYEQNNIHEDFLTTMAYINEESPSTTGTTQEIHGVNSISTVYKLTSALSDPPQTSRLAELGQKHNITAPQNDNFISENVSKSRNATTQTASSQTKNHKNNRIVSGMDTSPVNKHSTRVHSERSPRTFSPSTISPLMEDKTRAVNPTVVSIPFAENILSIQDADAKTVTQNVKKVSDGIHVDITNTTKLQKNMADSTTRIQKTESSTFTQATEVLGDLGTTHTTYGSSIKTTTISYATKLDTDGDTLKNNDHKLLDMQRNHILDVDGFQVENDGGLYNNKKHNLTTVNDTMVNENITNKVEATSDSMLRNETKQEMEIRNSGNEMRAPLTSYNSLLNLQVNSSQNKTNDLEDITVSNVRPFTSGVVPTSRQADDKITTANVTIEGTTSQTSRGDITLPSTNISNLSQDTLYLTPTSRSHIVSADASTHDLLQDKLTTLNVNVSMTAARLADGTSMLPSGSALPSRESSLSYTHVFNETLDTKNTNTTFGELHLSTPSNLPTQSISTSTGTGQIHSYDRSVAEDKPVMPSERNVSVVSKQVLQQVTNVDQLINPFFIDYRNKTLRNQTETDNDQAQTEESERRFKSTIEEWRLLDKHPIARHEKDAKAQIEKNFTKSERVIPSSTENTTLFLDSTFSERKPQEDIVVSAITLDPTHLSTRSDANTILSHPSKGSMLAGSLTKMASKIAETKANLARINAHLLNLAERRIKVEHTTDSIPTTTNMAFKISDKHVSGDTELTTVVPKDNEQLTAVTFPSEKLDGVAGSTSPAFNKTSSMPTEYFSTESVTSVSEASIVDPSSKDITLDVESYVGTREILTPTTSVPVDKIKGTLILTDSSGTLVNSPQDHVKVSRQNTLNGQSDTKVTGDVTHSGGNLLHTDLDFVSNVVLTPGKWNAANDFSQYPLKDNYQNKLNALPYIHNIMKDVSSKSKPSSLLDPWKVYNIALSKSKSRHYKGISEPTGAPEIHLFSDYKFGRAPEDSHAKNYLWKARPWQENTHSMEPQNMYNKMLADKSRLSQSKDIPISDNVNYQTKMANKIHSVTNHAAKIKNANIWGNRFNQAYYGRVLDDQSNYMKPGDSTIWPRFQSQDMVNFDTIGHSSQNWQGKTPVHDLKNKYNMLNEYPELKPSDTIGMNEYPQYGDTVKDDLLHSDHKVVKGSKDAVKSGFPAMHLDKLDIMTDVPANRQVTNGAKNGTRAAMVSDEMNQLSNELHAISRGVPAHADYKCPGLFGYHRDQENCQAFFICSWGMAHRVVCPPGTLYNAKEAVCDWAVNVRCDINRDKATPFNF